MQRRLLELYSAVRAQSDRVRWTFLLRTVDNITWSEEQLANSGMPPTWVVWIIANADFPTVDKHSNGCFSTHRSIRPRYAVRNITTLSKSLVADVLEEFTTRLSKYR
ncbi:MAG TPA: hypothetical protein PKA41_14755 [Verrucomicrobiota bacterium]|nr:hypothetical protein [Verrucomicrobiota bacterium]